MIIRKIDRDITCTCRHSWEDHHQSCVQNPEYFDYPLTIDGCIGQECEHDQCNGEYFVSREKACKCNGFKPASKYIQGLVKAWQENHPPRR